MAAFIIATGAAGMAVPMHFTYWGLAAIKKKTIFSGKPLTEKMMATMLDSGPKTVGSSNLNMPGMSPLFFKYVMKSKNVS